MEGQWWRQLNPPGGGDGRDEWREVLAPLGIPYCVHFVSLWGTVCYQERVICELAEAKNFWS